MYRFVYLGAIVPILAFAAVAVAPSITTLALACLAGGLWGGCALAFIVCDPVEYFSICGLLGSVTAVQYLLCAALSLAMWGNQAIDVYDYLSTGTIMPVAAAGIYVLAYSLVLIAFGKYENTFWRKAVADMRTEVDLGFFGIWLIIACAGLQIVAMALGMRAFSQFIAIDESDQVPMFWGFLAQATMALPVVIPWVMRSAVQRRQWGTFIGLAGAALVNLLWFAMQSRVVFAVVVMLAILSYAWSRPAPVSLRRLAMIAMAAVPLVVGGWLLLSSVRILTYGENAFSYNERSYRLDTENVKDISEALSLLRNGGDWVADALIQNVALRAFYIGYLRTLMAHQVSDPYLYGSDTMISLVMGVPRAILPWKRDIVGDFFYTTEWRMNRSFGFEVADMPDTLVTAAYGNFGLSGLAIYPLIIAGFGILLALLARSATYPLLRLFVFGLAITLGVIVEVNLTMWVIVLRTCLVMAVAAELFAMANGGAAAIRKPVANLR